jgi:hypothetical protein
LKEAAGRDGGIATAGTALRDRLQERAAVLIPHGHPGNPLTSAKT